MASSAARLPLASLAWPPLPPDDCTARRPARVDLSAFHWRERPHGPGAAAARWRRRPEILGRSSARSRASVGQRVIDGVPQFAATRTRRRARLATSRSTSACRRLRSAARVLRRARRALVSGTTGLDAAQLAALDAAAARIPVLWASNFSLGVAVLVDLVERAAAALPGWDCDIVEAHHVRKQDAPSGTALTLGEAAARGGAQRRATRRCAPATSSASTRCSSPRRASASSWCTAPPTATSSPAARCTRPPRLAPAGRRAGYRDRRLLLG